MNRAQKEEQVQSLNERLTSAPYVALADYRGVTVEQINAFRRTLDENGVGYEVIKNTLAKRAIQGTSLEGLEDLLNGMTAWVISGEDPVLAAKTLRDASKPLVKEEVFSLKGGFFDGEMLDANGIAKVADYPSKEELLVTLLRTLQAGPRQVLGVLQAPGRDLLYLLKNYEAKLEQGA